MTILIVDDNVNLLEVLKEYAVKEGYWPLFQTNQVDLILLDIMMPDMDGYEVCRRVRASSDVPILMITAKGEDSEKICGLDMGADDYIVKPFSPSEVMARIRAVLRRIQHGAVKEKKEKDQLRIDNLFIDMYNHSVSVGDVPVPLTKKEMDLLWIMCSHPGRVFTRDCLLEQVWGMDYDGYCRAVDSRIKRLRAKLDMAEHPNWCIRTVWGDGYKFEVKHAQ